MSNVILHGLLGLVALSSAGGALVQTQFYLREPMPLAMLADEGDLVDKEVVTLPSDPIRRAPDGLFYVTALVNGAPVRFAVDTGATIVVLNAADAKRAGIKVDAHSDRIQTASGYSDMVWGKANTLNVAGRDLGPTRMVVMHGPSVSLLGLNALGKFNSMIITKNELRLD